MHNSSAGHGVAAVQRLEGLGERSEGEGGGQSSSLDSVPVCSSWFAPLPPLPRRFLNTRGYEAAGGSVVISIIKRLIVLLLSGGERERALLGGETIRTTGSSIKTYIARERDKLV